MTVSTGVSSVPESALSTVADPATPTLLIPTCTDVAMDPEDAEGLPSTAQQDPEGVERLTGVVVEGNVKSSRVIEKSVQYIQVAGNHHQVLQRTVPRALSMYMLKD